MAAHSFWPMIHEITPVNMNTLPLKVSRTTNDALITKDRMRVDVEAEFYVRVQPERRAVAMAASTLGRRTLEPESLHALLAGKFESAMRAAAATMDMSGMHENRTNYVERVRHAVEADCRATDSSSSPLPSSTSIRRVSSSSILPTGSMPRA